ncbi:MAG: DUF1634 domain-containing protein [Bacteroidetes bacterium]|nr:DUF1634 domain-containing protein [Bacteroidota bacterium]MBS1931315.1 DUF1634 domain-containing protein [Bacteroidota bacterium]
MKNYWQDKDIEVTLGNLLRWGVMLSSIIVLIGGIIYLAHYGGTRPDYKTFHGLLEPYHSLATIFSGVKKLKGEAIIQLGVVILIATPVARIIFSIFGFIREKDILYIFIALIVLGIIVTSMSLGLKG